MLPKESYLYPTGYAQVANESNERYSLDIKEGVKQGWIKQEPTPDGQNSMITCIPNNGVFLPITGASFPLKCYADAGAVFAFNLVKAQIIETTKLIAKWYFVPALALVNKQQVLDTFNRIAFKAVSPHLLQDNCLTDFAREVKKALNIFLSELGFTDESVKTCATLISNLFDYDNVYRLRMEDTFSETNVSKLKTRKEIKRLLLIMKQREVRPGDKGKAIHYKFKVVAWLLSLALLIPKVRRAFNKMLDGIDIRKLQTDEIDLYWMCLRNDYLWLGLTDEERKQFAINKGWKFPQPMKE